MKYQPQELELTAEWVFSCFRFFVVDFDSFCSWVLWAALVITLLTFVQPTFFWGLNFPWLWQCYIHDWARSGFFLPLSFSWCFLPSTFSSFQDFKRRLFFWVFISVQRLTKLMQYHVSQSWCPFYFYLMFSCFLPMLWCKNTPRY